MIVGDGWLRQGTGLEDCDGGVCCEGSELEVVLGGGIVLSLGGGVWGAVLIVAGWGLRQYTRVVVREECG